MLLLRSFRNTLYFNRAGLRCFWAESKINSGTQITRGTALTMYIEQCKGLHTHDVWQKILKITSLANDGAPCSRILCHRLKPATHLVVAECSFEMLQQVLCNSYQWARGGWTVWVGQYFFVRLLAASSSNKNVVFVINSRFISRNSLCLSAENLFIPI